MLIFGTGQKSYYYKYRDLYSSFKENDRRALAILNLSILKAKQIRDYHHLTYAYEDAVFYTPYSSDKLKYADSALAASLKSGIPALITRSHLGKGIVYYFNYKNYSAALTHYLDAYQWSQKTSDDYLKFKVKYHLGVVKNYLGYYEESIDHFKDCHQFFEMKLQKKLHPDDVFNNTRGLLNSMHQQIIANLYLNNISEAERLITKGINIAGTREDFSQEKAYFLKCSGIVQFLKGHFDEAEKSLQTSIQFLKDKKDFASIAVAHYYLGKINLKRGAIKTGISYLKKVDSSFVLNSFMLPEVRSAYTDQIKYAKIQKNSREELYSMNQLIKVDRILATEYPYLSSRIHREYDTANLIKEKGVLQKSNRLQTGLLWGGSTLSLILIGLLLRRNIKQKRINRNYEKVFQNIKNEKLIVTEDRPAVIARKTIYDQKTVDEILEKLDDFENGTKFLQKGLTLRKLATILKTNGTHLSYVINDYKKMNFNMYIKTLRINYITRLMYTDPYYLKFTVDSLAKECGISSRQVFSDQFYEINGLRPADFIAKRLKEIKDSSE